MPDNGNPSASTTVRASTLRASRMRRNDPAQIARQTAELIQIEDQKERRFEEEGLSIRLAEEERLEAIRLAEEEHEIEHEIKMEKAKKKREARREKEDKKPKEKSELELVMEKRRMRIENSSHGSTRERARFTPRSVSPLSPAAGAGGGAGAGSRASQLAQPECSNNNYEQCNRDCKWSTYYKQCMPTEIYNDIGTFTSGTKVKTFLEKVKKWKEQTGGSVEDIVIEASSEDTGILPNVTNKSIKKLRKGLDFLEKNGFNSKSDQDIADLLYSNKFNQTGGYQTIFSSIKDMLI